jgi:exopolysaccharide production protein ExoQ
LLEFKVHTSVAQFSHVTFFCLAGLLVLCGRHRTDRLQRIFGGGALLMAAVFFGEAISYISHDNYSTAYGFMFILILLSARLIVQEIGITEIMRAYSQAAMLIVGYFVLFDFRKILAGTTNRFAGTTGVHPNLVGFVVGGFFPVLVWRALEYTEVWRRRVAVFLVLTAAMIIFLTGSRGSLTAVFLSGTLLLLRSLLREGLLSRIRVSHRVAILAAAALPLLAGMLAQHNRIAHLGDYLVSTLQLNTAQRGIRSGFSGRTGIWSIALRLLRTENRWLVGFGYRAGDRMVGTIDNGYIQLLFESGLIAGTIILGSMVRVLLVLWRAIGTAPSDAWKRYYMVASSIMVIYFVNNISTRYLFSFGSSFSLCVLCMTVCSRRELLGSGARRPAAESATPSRGIAPTQLAWNPPARY